MLADLGLVAATRWLAYNNLEQAGVMVNFKTIGQERRLPARLETTLFRVIQEAISNIVRHAHAKNAEVSLHFKKNTFEARVRDNGKGFDVNEAYKFKG